MTQYARPVKYNHAKEAEFQTTLKERVDAHFVPHDGSRKATLGMWAKLSLFFVLFWMNWSALALHVHSLGTTIALLVSFALLFKCIAYNVAHDAVHSALTGNSKIDDKVFWVSFNMLGPNGYLWKIRHNNAHHFFVNIPGCDVDIEGTKMIRLAPHKEWLPVHRFQHLYAPLLYMVFTLDWIFRKDFALYFRKEFGNVTGLKHPWWRFAEMIALKLFYVGYMIVIPCLVLPYSVGTILLAFVGFHLFLSLYVVMTFAASHIGEDAHFVAHDEEGKLPHSFLEHQLRTSIDFHPRNPVVGFFYGGFNAHVAHHMFPSMSSIHYAPVTKIIQETASEFGLPYFERSLVDLFASHFRFLKLMGTSPNAGAHHLMHPPAPISTLSGSTIRKDPSVSNLDDTADTA
jgi:linoleoyl-CoA desaturase